jgi:hypothetical protein
MLTDGGVYTKIAIRNLAGNLFLFLPFGFYLPFFIQIMKRLNIFMFTVAGLIIIVEVMQSMTRRGSIDVDDLILNLLGALIGFMLCNLGFIERIKRQGGGYDKEALNEIKNSSDVDADPEQLKRQISGMDKKCTPATIDYEAKSATFTGSGKSHYTTTIESCTCRDYSVRRLPCKHIYRLMYEMSKAD